MALVTLREILLGIAGEYAVGAFNVHNMEYTQAVIEAAEMEESPVILMVGEAMLQYAGMGWIAAICRYAAESTDLPVAIHLDHSKSLDSIKAAIRSGCSSVMFDGSHLPWEENLSLTKKVVTIAHSAGVSVEGELGVVGGVEDDVEALRSRLTEPLEAREFAQLTGVDALAVAIGNCHGLYRGKPELDMGRLRDIAKLTDCPLVMHGGSAIPDFQVREAIRSGIRKFNVGTELKIAFRDGLQQALARTDSYEVPKVLGPARQAVRDLVREKLRLFGCCGKA